MTDMLQGGRKYNHSGSDVNRTNNAPKRPQTSTSIKTSGLTQELENLTISDTQDTATNLNEINCKWITKKHLKKKNSESPLRSFIVPNREAIENILLKISKDSPIVWMEGKYGYKCRVVARKFGKICVN